MPGIISGRITGTIAKDSLDECLEDSQVEYLIESLCTKSPVESLAKFLEKMVEFLEEIFLKFLERSFLEGRFEKFSKKSLVEIYNCTIAGKMLGKIPLGFFF